MEEQKKRWYIVQTYSGQEDSVQSDIESRTKSLHMQDYIFRVVVPKEEVISKNNKGVEVKKEKKIYPGYVFIEMIMQEEAWFVVRNTPHVTGILGSSGKGTLPVPLLDSEITPILIRAGITDKPTYGHLIGKTVKFTSGPFGGRTGIVKSVDNDRKQAIVDVSYFGQLTETTTDIDIITEIA